MSVTRADNTPRGIALMLGFILLGPFIDVFAKLATETVPVLQIAVLRFAVQGALLIPLAIVMGLFILPSRAHALAYLARGALILASTACIVGAVKFMPVADAIAIVFVEPLILMLIGWAFLGETVGWRRLTACVIGFIGALLVIQPNFAAFGWPALLPLATAVFFAFYLLLTRSMAVVLHPVTLQAWTSVAAVGLGLPLLLVLDDGLGLLDLVMPEGKYLWYVLGCGLAATISHLFLSSAFKYAPTTVLGTITYLEIVTATLYGLIIFGDFFGPLAAIGACLIIAVGLYTAHREAQLSKAPQEQG